FNTNPRFHGEGAVNKALLSAGDTALEVARSAARCRKKMIRALLRVALYCGVILGGDATGAWLSGAGIMRLARFTWGMTTDASPSQTTAASVSGRRRHGFYGLGSGLDAPSRRHRAGRQPCRLDASGWPPPF